MASRSRSRSRSRSGQRSRSHERGRDLERTSRSPREDGGSESPESTEIMEMSRDEASFVMGKMGKTKQKLEYVSGAVLTLDEQTHELTIRGTEAQRKRAKIYVKFMTQQRTGTVDLDPEDHKDDCSTIEVPRSCVGYVTGRMVVLLFSVLYSLLKECGQGTGLRNLEDEFKSLVFFFGLGKDRSTKSEQLAIFGPKRARRSTQLKVMATVESKDPGDPRALCHHSSCSRSIFFLVVQGITPIVFRTMSLIVMRILALMSKTLATMPTTPTQLGGKAAHGERLRLPAVASSSTLGSWLFCLAPKLSVSARRITSSGFSDRSLPFLSRILQNRANEKHF